MQSPPDFGVSLKACIVLGSSDAREIVDAYQLIGYIFSSNPILKVCLMNITLVIVQR